jgi:prepilin-type N-terminal cleavage/methylation domain-containing protein
MQRKTKKYFYTRHSGFTLIELLIVVGIIGILASIVIVNLEQAKAKARDTERKANLNSISRALESHYSSNGTYVVAGTGASGTGSGWFSYVGSGYPVSVAQGLVNLGHFPVPLVDPSGNTASYTSIGAAYLIEANATGFTVWTSLEYPTTQDTDTLDTCALSGYDGYANAWPANRRTNYCVSSN